MRKGGGKSKGSAAEREVAKLFSLWWSDGEDDSIFYLTAGSGARQTSRRKCGIDTHNSAGDMGYLDISGKPLIDLALFEIKRGYNKEIDLLATVDSAPNRKENILVYWIKKAEKERQENNRAFVFLIIRRDYKEYCIVYSKELEKHTKLLPDFNVTVLLYDNYRFMPLEDWFKWMTRDDFLRLS